MQDIGWIIGAGAAGLFGLGATWYAWDRYGDWFKGRAKSVLPTRIPKLTGMIRLVDETRASDWKICAVQATAKGVCYTTYHNVTRKDSALRRWWNGQDKELKRTTNETIGQPAKIGNAWWFTLEQQDDIVVYNEATGSASTAGKRQPEKYSTMAVGEWFIVSRPVRPGDNADDQSFRCFLWNPQTGQRGHTFKELRGIASGAVQIGSQIIVSVSDGKRAGIESTDGWVVRDFGGVAALGKIGDVVIALARNGTVARISAAGKALNVVRDIDLKAVRAISLPSGLVIWTTSNPDCVCATNGKDVEVIHRFSGSDLSDGLQSGSLFDSALSLDGDKLYIGRSQHKGGYELWEGTLT